MNCEEFQRGLASVIEERHPISASLREHGMTCQQSGCYDAWDEFTLLDSAISQWKNTTHAVDFVDQVIENSLPQGRTATVATRRQRIRGVSRVLTGLPGGLLVVGLTIALTWFAYFPKGHQATQPQELSTPVVAAQTTPIAEHEAGYQQLGVLYVSWVADAASGLTGSVASALTPLESPDTGSATQSTGSWIQSWEQQLRPFGEELRHTVRPLTTEEPGDQTNYALPASTDIT